MKHILLIIGGGIAAYKASELVRLLRRHNHIVTCVMTEAAHHFITPMTLAALSERPVYTTLWNLKDETEMGHIQLSRQADLIVVAPATADLLARMAGGIADDLATTLLLATDKPVLVAPAMNVRMWTHAATQRNVAVLALDGISFAGPVEGPMACGEFGPGRMAEPDEILAAIGAMDDSKQLSGCTALVTAGPTQEPIDPVRFIGNRSSGKQGFAIAEALARRGATVTLVTGPVALPTPPQVNRIDIETAGQMARTVEAALPVDIAVMVAAVADWRVEPQPAKLKKADGLPTLHLVENIDILARLGSHARRPRLLIGFAAETEDVVANGREKLMRKRCDLIVANDVSSGVFGSERNHVHLIDADGVEDLPAASKHVVAERLVEVIVERISRQP